MAAFRSLLVLLPVFCFSCLLHAEDVPYGVSTSRFAPGLGNHRARLAVAEKAEAVWAHIPWRRRDPSPEKKNVLVVSAAGKPVPNRVAVDINREFGDVIFRADAPGEYFVYYLPYVGSGRSNYPRVTYPEPQATADAEWLRRIGLTPDAPGSRVWE